MKELKTFFRQKKASPAEKPTLEQTTRVETCTTSATTLADSSRFEYVYRVSGPVGHTPFVE
jgi:hypothetical protein